MAHPVGYRLATHLHSYSFPTRRSSDLLDRIQMEQVFVNVLKNALEAIGADGTVTLRLGQRGPRPFVTIEDSGPRDRKSTRLNSSHRVISYAVFCLKIKRTRLLMSLSS